MSTDTQTPDGRRARQDGEESRGGALRRLQTDPVSRRKFMAASGTAGALGVVLAACGSDDETTSSSAMTSGDTSSTSAGTMGSDALAEFGDGDLGVVNYALTLEYLEAAFYADVIKSGLFKGQDLANIKAFGANEDAHVKALEATAKKLGKVAPKPKVEFPLEDAQSVLELAATVENLGAAAYLGAAPLIESEDILAAALSIHSVEARHASALNLLLEEPITPDGAFAKPASPEEVLPEVQPFIVS
jgi:hypothetical protein